MLKNYETVSVIGEGEHGMVYLV